MNETTNQKYTRPKPAWLRLAFIYVIIFVVALSFAVGYLVGAVRPNSSLQVFTDIVDEAPSQLDDKTVDFSLFWDIWNSLKDGYLRQPISERDAFYGSLKGMVASLDDPYSTFLDPAETKEFDSEINGQFEGIGAEIGLKDERIVIIAPLPNSPAEEAGARAGDVIETIDGQTTIGMSVDEAVHLIRGQKGTAVELVVLREGSEEVIELIIERDTITTTSVSWRMIDDTIAYVLVTSFSADTLDQFNQAITELLVEEPAGFILDLRGNPGGFLDVAVEFTGEFIDGQVVVIEKFGEGEQIEHSSERPSRLPDIDTVVLVNHGTASASEIVAGALQDYERAIVIGEQTFGKGSVQDYTEFEDGSSLKLTVAEWLTPDGRSINETGITPDQMVELTADDFQASNDTQLNAAIEFLNNQ